MNIADNGACDVPNFPLQIAGRDGEGVTVTSSAPELKGREWKAPFIGDAVRQMNDTLAQEYEERARPTPQWMKEEKAKLKRHQSIGDDVV